MKESWQTAELLEEIAKRADPVRVLTLLRGTDSREDGMMYVITVGDTAEDFSVTYNYPLDRIMAGTKGTPEELVEWLETGLGKNEGVTLSEMGGQRRLTIIQKGFSEAKIEDLRRLIVGTQQDS